MKKRILFSLLLISFFSNTPTYAYQLKAEIAKEPMIGGNSSIDKQFQPIRSECRINPTRGTRSSCKSAEAEAANTAGHAVILDVIDRGTKAIQTQTEICSNQVAAFEKQCDYSKVQEAQLLISDIKNTIEQRVNSLTNINTESGRPEFRSKSILGKMLETAKKLQNEIDAANKFLEDQKIFITDFTNTCNKQIENVRTVCVDPQYGTIGEQININIVTPNQSQVLESVSAIKSATDREGEAEATVLVHTSGTFPATEAENKKNMANSTYNTATQVRRNTSETLAETKVVAEESRELANRLITSLETIVAPSDPTKIEGRLEHGLMDGGADPIDTVDPTRPPSRSASSSTGNTPNADNVLNTRNTNGATASKAGGVSAQQAQNDALANAYGAGTPDPSSNSNETNGNKTTNNSAGAPGGVGSMMNGLSGLGSMFGKTTGGGFGNDSSYGSSRIGRYNNDGNFRYRPSQQSGADYVYTPKSGNTSANQQQASNQRAFAGGNPSTGAYSGMPMAGGTGSNMNMGGSPSNTAAPTKKPSFLDKLLGRDKTLFGKKTAGAGGGSFGMNSSSSSRDSYLRKDMNPSGDSLKNKDKARVFDASKYAPSKAAQERAYARATGRKIASHASGIESSSKNKKEWPEDISLDKRSHMFRKASFKIRVTISE